MNRVLLTLALIVVSMASASSASYGEPGIDLSEAEGEADPIVVIGQAIDRRRIGRFIESITVEVSGDQLAAFQAAVCPYISGLGDDHSRFVAARVLDVAEAVGVDVAEPGCAPNLIVIFAADGPGLVSQLHAERRELFAGLSAFEIDRLLDRRDAVTQWNIIDVHGADGREMRHVSQLCFGPINCHPVDLHVLEGMRPSRIRTSTRSDIAASVLVVESAAIEGATLLQVADYVAMRSLARTREVAGTSPTILSLLHDLAAGAIPVPEASAWDLAYLHALYATDRSVSAWSQRSSMLRLVNELLDAPESRQPARGAREETEAGKEEGRELIRR